MKRGLRWFSLGAGAVVGVVVLLLGVLYLVGSRSVGRTHEVQAANLVIPTDSAAVASGLHLVQINGCMECHGEDLSGRIMVDAPPFRVVASNLTRGRGGIGSVHTAEDFDRAMRHGVRPNGRSLLLMPSVGYHNLSDRDAARIIAYLQNAPPVDNELPATEVRPLGRILSAVTFDPAAEVRTSAARAIAPEPSDGAEYGAYLASVTCAYCHGQDLRGGQPPMPDSPPAPDLAAAGQWAFADFEQALRTGVIPGGRQLNPAVMPWTFTARMSDDELRALHAYFATLASGSGP